MNFPSISFIYKNAINTFRQFPFAVTMAVLASISAIWYIELDYSQRNSDEFLHKMILLSTLGISLFTAMAVTADRWTANVKTFWIVRLSGLLLLAVYFILLPQSLFDAPDKHSIRLGLFFIGSHLLVAVAPFLKKGHINGFWQYNKTLFLRFLTAFLYSNVLYVGLAVALLSIDYLLGVDIKGERYGQLWVVILFIFNTWFFLAGIPDDLDKLNQRTDYPKGLEFFTQYVLLPLVSVYMIILYLYAAKIIFNWSWPEGWVANLILSFSILGILSLLLLYPVRNKAESRWIQQFSKGYYLILLPLVCMLLLAVWRRISEYGFTENRYFVLVAGIWLGSMALYFLISNRKNIKIIPASLAAMIFIISFGPWGAISVSESSQIQRLKTTLTDNNILTEDQINPAEGSVTIEEQTEISAGVLYLAEVHGLDEIQHWFEEDLKTPKDSSESISSSTLARNVVEMMGLEYVNTWGTISPEYRRFSSVSRQPPVHLHDFEWLIKNIQLNHSRDVPLDSIDTHELFFHLQPDSMLLSINERESTLPVITIDLRPKINELNEEFGSQRSYDIPMNKMIVEQENESARIQLLLQNINVRKLQTGWKVENLNTDMLLKFKPQQAM